MLSTAFWLAYKAPFKITGKYEISCPRAHMDHYYTRHERIARAFLGQINTTPYTLIECVNHSRNLEVTDRRDKIYAMMHLPYLDPDTRYVPIVDYSSSVEDVLKNYAAEHVRQTKTPEVLDYVTHTAETLHIMERSWVPRWHGVSETNWPMQSIRHLQRSTLQSHSGQPEYPRVDGNILRVRGVIFDPVVFSSETLHDYHPATLSEAMMAMLQQIWTLVESTTPDPYEQGWRLEVFLRVVILNIYQDDPVSWFQSAATVFFTLAKIGINTGLNKTPPWALRSTPKEPDLFYMRVGDVLFKSRVILTQRGYIGIAPLETRVGDICAIVFGCRTPCILREADAEGAYLYVGSMYMPGKTMTDILGDDGTSLGIDVNILGTEKSKDWVEWDDVEEQWINLL